MSLFYGGDYMIEFIVKYWLEILFTTITTGVLYMLKEYIGVKSGVKALLRNEIVRIYETYSKLGYCPSYMKENVSSIYSNYHKLGGNGYATNLMNEIYRLPDELKEDVVHEKNLERQFSW